MTDFINGWKTYTISVLVLLQTLLELLQTGAFNKEFAALALLAISIRHAIANQK